MSKALSASLEVPSSPGTYSAALEGLTRVNEVLMKREPVPPLYVTGARWEVRQGDPSETRWRYAPDVAGEGWGDCQDLSAYRAAELRVTGEDPKAEVRVYPTGVNRYHAVVARGNGAVEDPSVILGMDPISEAPFMTTHLPLVAGAPQGPQFQAQHQLVQQMKAAGAARADILAALKALHPNAHGGRLGPETGTGQQLRRVKDVAPEVTGPTFHVVPHVCGAGAHKWKGVHRVPLRDGTAIVGMTASHADPCDVIGDGAGLLSTIGHAILNHPLISAIVAPEALIAAKVTMDPATQYALKSTADAAHGSKDPDSIWGASSRSSRSSRSSANANRTRGGMPSQGGSRAMGIPGQPGVPMNALGLPPGMGPGGFPPGFPPPGMGPGMQGMPGPGGLPPGFNQFGPNAPGGGVPPWARQLMQQQQSGGGGGAPGPTAADFGLPTTPDVGPPPDAGSGFAPDSGSGFSDPMGGGGYPSAFDSAALDSYSDPTAALGYWNT